MSSPIPATATATATSAAQQTTAESPVHAPPTTPSKNYLNPDHESFDPTACFLAVQKLQPALETTRLTLDTPHENDDPAVLAMLNDHPTLAHLLFLARYPKGWTLADVVQRRHGQWKNVLNEERLSYFIHLKATGEFIGILDAVNLNLECKNSQVGVVLLKRFWGQGYGLEVQFELLRCLFEEYKLHKVTYETVETNVEMRRFLEESCGLKLTYINEDEDFCPVKGTFVSLYVYSIFERDWPRIRAALLLRLEQGAALAAKMKAQNAASLTGVALQQLVEP